MNDGLTDVEQNRKLESSQSLRSLAFPDGVLQEENIKWDYYFHEKFRVSLFNDLLLKAILAPPIM